MRLITRSDFDGLVCAILLEEQEIVSDYLFVHPKDVQDGNVPVTKNDVLANVPYVPGCGLWFDHHASELARVKLAGFEHTGAIVEDAPSCAQVIWDYYGGAKSFKKLLIPILKAVNRSDSAGFLEQEILFAEGWVLLSFIMNPRAGLGLYSDYSISNYQLMRDLIQYCKTMSIDEILALPDVEERAIRYNEHQAPYKNMLRRCSRVERNVVITNLLNEKIIYCGNRFIIFASHPDQNIELRIFKGKNQENVVLSCGHSIFNQTSKTDIGKLLGKYGGGGHRQVGSCQASFNDWERFSEEIVAQMVSDG